MSVSGTCTTSLKAAQCVAAGASADAAALQKHARLVDAAQKFEGMMLQELLKPMQEGKDNAWSGEDDPDRDGSLDNFSSYGIEAMANAISKQGGLGIAKQVLRQIGNVDRKGDAS